MGICSECEGAGAKDGTQPVTCTVCNGTGEVSYTQNTAFGRFVNVRTAKCNGEGTIIEEPCAAMAKESASLKDKQNVPAGIDNVGYNLEREGETGERRPSR